MARVLTWLAVPVLGALAGLTTLALDELAVRLLLGYTVPVFGAQIAVYLCAGAVCSVAVAMLRPGSGRASETDGARYVDGCVIWAASMALLASLTAVGRLQYFLRDRLPLPAGWPAAVAVAGAASAAWWLLLRFVLSRRGRTAQSAHAWASTLTAVSVGAGLAANRHAFAAPSSSAALGADAAILAATLVLAWLVARFGGWRVAGLSAATLAAWMLVPGWIPHGAGGDEQPDVVLVVVDTLRQDVFRSVLDATPSGRTFQRALGRAAYFDQAVAAAPWTVPSVASILTGLYPQEHGHGRQDGKGRFRRLADSVTTLAESFGAAGYRTEALVTNPWLHRGSGVDRGFEHFEELECPEGMLPLLILARRLGILRYGIYQPAEAVRQRLRRRLALRDHRPLFVWLHLMEPHQPYRRHPRLAADPAGLALSEIDRSYRDEVRHALDETAAMIDLLRRRGRWHDTVLVFVSDHGELLRSDGRGDGPGRRRFKPEGHGHVLYDELVRVPLVVRAPGVAAAAESAIEVRVEALASHVDVAATLLELAGLESVPTSGGRSLVPWLAAASAGDADRAVLAGTDARLSQLALRSRRWKLIHFPTGAYPDELYDLRQDPGERSDLAATRRPLRLRLRRQLEGSLAGLAATEAGAPLQLDAEDRARLRALGYVE